MKPIQYDRHARRRMKDRKVNQEEVELTIKNPDFLKQSIKGRTNAFIESNINNAIGDHYEKPTNTG